MRKMAYALIVVSSLTLILAGAAPTAALSNEQIVNNTRAFIEWAFGFRLDPATVQSIRAGTAIDMSGDPNGVLAVVQDMNTVMGWVHSRSAAESTLLRSLIEPQLVAAWQTDTGASSATSKRLVAVWRAHNRILADGQPPLRQSVVNAYLSMFDFISRNSGKPEPAAVANHAAFTARVARQYSSAPAESQLKFNQVQTVWLALQAMWANSSQAEKAAIVRQWRAPQRSVAARAPAPARSQGGFSSKLSLANRFSSEHLFVQSQTNLMMSSWTNPTAMY